MEENVLTWALSTPTVTDKQIEFEELMGKR
jgi:hypothetical protein